MSATLKVAVQIATADDELPPRADWSAWVAAALAAASIDAGSAGCVTLRLVGRQESQHLNETYRHKRGPTNVLAFPGARDAMLPGVEHELGDLVICLPVVHEEAAAQGKSALAHLAHLVVHGILHLVGFEHDEEAAARRMEAAETSVLKSLGFPPPYESSPDHGEDRVQHG